MQKGRGSERYREQGQGTKVFYFTWFFGLGL